MRPVTGVAALLLTSMYMILLGVLIDLAPRSLPYGMARIPGFGLDALIDRQLCGVVMLVLGAASYCLGGLWMLAVCCGSRRCVRDDPSDV